jgi:hypothetical protein
MFFHSMRLIRRRNRTEQGDLERNFLCSGSAWVPICRAWVVRYWKGSRKQEVHQGPRPWWCLPQYSRCRTLDLFTCVSVPIMGFSRYVNWDLSCCRDATAAPKGWATPYVIGCTVASIVLLVLFWLYERYRESKDLSVLMPPSMWWQPGSKMIPVISMVFFGWSAGLSHQLHYD